MNHSLAQLRKMVADRDAKIADLRSRVLELEKRMHLRERDLPNAMNSRCQTCGAEPGERCVRQSGILYFCNGRKCHHVRGRADRCHNDRCRECAITFGAPREITSPGSGT